MPCATSSQHHVRKRRVRLIEWRYDGPMWIESDVCYKALLARDARFDGRFYVGVSSTGIYCRPVCRVRTPRQENCHFFPSAAAAEAAGYRPCLRCRPELAPGHARVDAGRQIAHTAASLIDDGVLADNDLSALANRLHTSDRHLRRVFMNEFGVSPVAYAQTQRLLLAKRLLTDTDLPVVDVAMAAGFGSLRRFNTLFRERYRLQPRDLRKTPEAAPRSELTFELAYRPPYAWDTQLGFLGYRAIDGVEQIEDDRYARTVAIDRGDRAYRGWLSVTHRPKRHTLQVTLSGSLAAVAPEVLGRVKRLFDLDCRPDDIAAHLGELSQGTPGLRVPGAFDAFEMTVRAVLGQQITVKAARTLAGRVAQQLGEPLETPFPHLNRIFPTPSQILATDTDTLGQIGIIRMRSRAIFALAEACLSGDLSLTPGTPVEETLTKLRALPGIGDWTAQYVVMRALAWPDAFPAADAGLMKALRERSPRRITAIAERWRPWRAYAVMHLWHGGAVTHADVTHADVTHTDMEGNAP